MIDHDPTTQQRFIELPYKPARKPGYVEKLFDEPDFISLNLESKRKFQLRWATYDSVFKELDSVAELIESVDGRGTIYRGAVPYNAEGHGLEVLPAFEDRVRNFSLLTKSTSLQILNVDSSLTHESSTNEVWLTLNRNDSAARYIVSRCVAITARDELGANADTILDEFAKYLPILSGQNSS